MEITETSLQMDVIAVSSLSVVPLILEIATLTTNMGFSAVARVTKERWIACAVHDNIQFGLLSGGELKVDTTICHEIRESGYEVVIDDVQDDEIYRNHHTPEMYGFRSYISVPLKRQDGGFFGTLCAIDPNPALLNNTGIVSMFKAFAQLISFHLNAKETLPADEMHRLEERTIAGLKEHFGGFFNNRRNINGSDTAWTEVMIPDKKDKKFEMIVMASSEKVKTLLAELNNLVNKEPALG